jgi:hypothetical protein
LLQRIHFTKSSGVFAATQIFSSREFSDNPEQARRRERQQRRSLPAAMSGREWEDTE